MSYSSSFLKSHSSSKKWEGAARLEICGILVANSTMFGHIIIREFCMHLQNFRREKITLFIANNTLKKLNNSYFGEKNPPNPG